MHIAICWQWWKYSLLFFCLKAEKSWQMFAVQAITGNPEYISAHCGREPLHPWPTGHPLPWEKDSCLSLRVACPGFDPFSCTAGHIADPEGRRRKWRDFAELLSSAGIDPFNGRNRSGCGKTKGPSLFAPQSILHGRKLQFWLWRSVVDDCLLCADRSVCWPLWSWMGKRKGEAQHPEGFWGRGVQTLWMQEGLYICNQK